MANDNVFLETVVAGKLDFWKFYIWNCSTFSFFKIILRWLTNTSSFRKFDIWLMFSSASRLQSFIDSHYGNHSVHSSGVSAIGSIYFSIFLFVYALFLGFPMFIFKAGRSLTLEKLKNFVWPHLNTYKCECVLKSLLAKWLMLLWLESCFLYICMVKGTQSRFLLKLQD